MDLPTRLRLLLALLLLGGFASCKPPAESIRLTDQVKGPPDLESQPHRDAASHGYQIRAFHLNHVWAGLTGRNEGGRAYRAKLTIWDYADDGSPVAELYFRDSGNETPARTPNPAQAKRPYQIDFPISTFGAILGTIRSTNEPVFLYYYDEGWAVGTYSAEPVGSD